MKKPYRSPQFNDERKWKANNPLDDVAQVGTHKAMGYVCITDTILLEDLVTMFPGKLVCYRPIHDGYSLPTYWVGDKKMIQAIINSNKSLLTKNDWSLDAEKIFDRICMYDVDHKYYPELYHFITDLFNSWCLWCEKPIWVYNESEPLSERPYDPDTNG